MKDHAVVPASTEDADKSRLVTVLRRAVVTGGFLVGFGALALFTAGQASAEDHPPGESPSAEVQAAPSKSENLLSDLVTPVTNTVGNLTKPVVQPVAEQLAPVVRPVAEAAAPLVRPVMEAVGPVVEPVTGQLMPVLEPVTDAVAPVTEPLAGPLLHAAQPVLTPVAEATGAEDAISGLSGQRAEAAERILPAVPPSTLPSTSGSTPTPLIDVTAPAVASGERVETRSTAVPATPNRPGDSPVLPLGPNAVTGGTATNGAGVQHSADGMTQFATLSSEVDSQDGRAPPGAAIADSWRSYDDHDHPG